MLQAEMIEKVSSAQVGSSLRNQFGSLHLRIPCRRRVNRDFQAVCLSRICRVFVAWVEGEVMGSGLRTMDVLHCSIAC